MDLSTLEQQLTDDRPPFEQWQPSLCGDIDIRIDREGRWFHEGSEIKRLPLVKLFARVLVKEGEDYFLMTPVEKMRIQVEETPFVMVDADLQDSRGEKSQEPESFWLFTSNLGHKVALGPQHPLELAAFNQQLKPTIKVRDNIWATLHRNVYYRLIDQATEVPKGDSTSLVLHSQGNDYPLGDY